MKLFVFPGQGSQSVGMGKELADNFSVAQDVFNEVDDALGEKLSHIIFNGDDAELAKTFNTQPALMATSIATLRVLEQEAGQDITQMADYVAGHSLGEYSALAATGAISLSDTARLLRIRGNAMQSAVPAGKGGMAALLGVDYDTVQEICQKASASGVCEVANDNGGGQIVISGEVTAIDAAEKIAAEYKIKRFVKLNVSAPFHSSLIASAGDKMAEALSQVTVQNPSIKLIANVTADVVSSPEEVKKLLVEQVTARVRWRETIENLGNLGVTELYEIGAGKVLTGLTKRIFKAMSATSIQNIDDIQKFLDIAAS